jgi:TrpR-related protein YerC/YecD
MTDKERLIQALLLADNKKLMQDFLNDLFTEKEFKSLTIRFKAMCLLKDAAPYSTVHSATKLSPTTISRLSKKIRDWDGGFQTVIQKFTDTKKTYIE